MLLRPLRKQADTGAKLPPHSGTVLCLALLLRTQAGWPLVDGALVKEAVVTVVDWWNWRTSMEVCDLRLYTLLSPSQVPVCGF